MFWVMASLGSGIRCCNCRIKTAIVQVAMHNTAWLQS